MSLVSLRAQLEIVSGYIDPTIKPTSVEGCDYTWDNSSYLSQQYLTTTTMTTTASANSTPDSKQLSFYYYSLFGMLITISVSNIASLLIERNKDWEPIDPRLLAPMVRKLFNGYTRKETEMKLMVHTFDHVNQKVISPTTETDSNK